MGTSTVGRGPRPQPLPQPMICAPAANPPPGPRRTGPRPTKQTRPRNKTAKQRANTVHTNPREGRGQDRGRPATQPSPHRPRAGHGTPPGTHRPDRTHRDGGDGAGPNPGPQRRDRNPTGTPPTQMIAPQETTPPTPLHDTHQDPPKAIGAGGDTKDREAQPGPRRQSLRRDRDQDQSREDKGHTDPLCLKALKVKTA